jgi:hypothetical protein
MVYFIHNRRANAIKIGVSNDPIGRMVFLQTGCPDRLEMACTVPGGTLEEAELHRRFAADRISGEWFEVSEALVAWIEGYFIAGVCGVVLY